VKDICFLIENSFDPKRKPLVLRSTQAILDDVHNHLFNDILWPDFSKIFVDPQRSKTLMRFEKLYQGFEIDKVKVSFETVNHPVNAVGYILDDGNKQIVFTGDTGPTHAIWAAANECPNLAAVFTEISFPSRMDGLARASGHFTPKQLLEELDKINNKDIPIFIAHFKPFFFEELMDEFHRTVSERVKLLHQEDEFIFS
jgi:cAMP phosphodiesterase